MKWLKALFENLVWFYEECKWENRNGSWDKYHARRNARMQRCEERRKHREVK